MKINYIEVHMPCKISKESIKIMYQIFNLIQLGYRIFKFLNGILQMLSELYLEASAILPPIFHIFYICNILYCDTNISQTFSEQTFYHTNIFFHDSAFDNESKKKIVFRKWLSHYNC